MPPRALSRPKASKAGQGKVYTAFPGQPLMSETEEDIEDEEMIEALIRSGADINTAPEAARTTVDVLVPGSRSSPRSLSENRQPSLSKPEVSKAGREKAVKPTKRPSRGPSGKAGMDSDMEDSIVLHISSPKHHREQSVKSDQDLDPGLFDAPRFTNHMVDTDGFELLGPELVERWWASHNTIDQVSCTQIDQDEERQRAQDANAQGDPEDQLDRDALNWNDEHDLDREEGENQPWSLPDELDERTILAQKYENAMEAGLLPLVSAALSDENEHSKSFQSVGRRWLEDNCLFSIVASTHRCILQQIINGNLARAKRRDPVIRAELEKLRLKGNSQPAIYMQLLVNSQGCSPTPEELTEVIDWMRDYCDLDKDGLQQQRAAQIDTAFNPNSRWGMDRVKRGELKYLWSTQDRDLHHRPCQSHIDNINDFCSNLERRLQHVRQSPGWTEPLAVPLVEFGYACSPVQRLKEHRTHQKSNYIMNLADAVCRLLFHEKYYFEQYVIYHLFRPEQAAASEILFTRLGQGYTLNGGGFSHYLAGRSNHTAMGVTALNWSKYLKDAWENSSLRQEYIQTSAAFARKILANERADEERQAWQAEEAEERRKIEELKAELADLEAEKEYQRNLWLTEQFKAAVAEMEDMKKELSQALSSS